MRVLGGVLFVLGLLLVAVAIIYWTVPVGHLPSLLGHTAGSTRHHSKRALAAAVAGVLFLIGGWVAFTRRPSLPSSSD